MGIIELILISLGLSMDAFVVSIGKGISLTDTNKKKILIIAIFFGGFQALMPLIGYFIGTTFSEYIVNYDHWIAFILLGYIGVNMIIDALSEDHEEEKDSFSIKEILILAIATSIDALAVGVTFALLPNINITTSIIVIGSITFALSYIGVLFGKKIGEKSGKMAEVFGGLILISIGSKILIEHLFFL